MTQHPSKPVIPKPPTPAEQDQLSQDQALISDEWGGDQLKNRGETSTED